MNKNYTDIEKFDRAVFDYLTSISRRIVYAPTQNALRTITRDEIYKDNKPWNFISFYRNSSFDINWSRMNNPATVSGDFVRLTQVEENLREARYVNNIPVNLTYSVDIWASKAKEVQETAIALISKLFMTDQVLEVPINPEGEIGRFHLDNISWDDNSDLERENEIGKIYRHTINFTVDARITMVKDVLTTKFCCVPVDIYEGENLLDFCNKGGK